MCGKAVRSSTCTPDDGDDEAAVRVAVDEHAVAGHLLLDEDHALGACAHVHSHAMLCTCTCSCTARLRLGSRACQEDGG